MSKRPEDSPRVRAFSLFYTFLSPQGPEPPFNGKEEDVRDREV